MALFTTALDQVFTAVCCGAASSRDSFYFLHAVVPTSSTAGCRVFGSLKSLSLGLGLSLSACRCLGLDLDFSLHLQSSDASRHELS
jgi:hypothetical protein